MGLTAQPGDDRAGDERRCDGKNRDATTSVAETLTSLGIHSWCRTPLAIDENPSGWFWGAGVDALADDGGDLWSTSGVMDRSTWADFGPAPSHKFTFSMIQSIEGRAQ